MVSLRYRTFIQSMFKQRQSSKIFIPLVLFIFLCSAGESFAQKSTSLFRQYQVKDGLPGNKVYAVNTDVHGYVWIATSRGLSRFTRNGFQVFGTEYGLPESTILGIFNDNNSRTWFRTSSGTLAWFDKNRFYAFPGNEDLKLYLNNKIVNDMVFDGTGDLWVSTVIGGGLMRFNNKGVIVPLAIDDYEDCSYFIRILPGNNVISGSNNVFPANNRLKVIRNDKQYIVNLSATGGYTRSFSFRTSDGEILFLNGYEVLKLDDQKLKSRVLFEKSIESVFRDSEGKVWIGFYGGGVRCYPGGDPTRGNFVSYLGDRTTTGFTQDAGGNMWLGTNTEGMYFFPAALHMSSELNKISAFPPTPDDTTGESLSLKKTNVSEESMELRDSLPPKIFISGVRIMDRDTALRSSYTMEHDQNFIRINYAGLAGKNTGGMQYKYKMEGIDPDWIYTSSTSAQYTTLPPGEYSFKVLAMNNEGVWSSEEAEIKFSIKPAFYNTWWFRITAMLFVIMVLTILITYRVKMIRKFERERSEMEKYLSGLELNALRSQMNPHFIFNALNSIQNFILNNDTESAIRYQGKFAKLMRNILDHSRQTLIPVEAELKTLEIYMELESLRFEDRFDYAVMVDQKIDQSNTMIPPMIIQPFVENAIWHGLMHKSGKGIIQISLRQEGELIICSVEDNGVGRKKSMELQSKNRTRHKSQGMSITKERLKLMQTEPGIEGVIISDLEDDEGQIRGTKVDIRIPIES